MSSAADTSAPVRTNRFSIQFPMQSSHAAAGSPVRTSISPTRESTSGLLETIAMSADGNFLTAVAAQERRVLELKEELQKAEAELAKLKVHWAQHETQKKRDDAKSLTRLQPLQTSLPALGSDDDSSGSNVWMQQEMERRKALLSGSKSSKRTVFSGSRHTRALSLLSPRDDIIPSALRPFPQRRESLKKAEPQVQTPAAAAPGVQVRVPRAITMPDLNRESGDQMQLDLNALAQKAIDREMLLQTGKKMATDLKDGLWTFWEDLRQATVGEEATQILPPTQIQPPRRKGSTVMSRSAKKQSSKSSLRPSSRSSSVASKASAETKRASPVRKPKPSTLPELNDPSFWSDHGVMAPSATTPAPKKSPALPKHAKTPSKSPASVLNSDPWDTWDDSPEQSRSSSAASEATTLPSTIPSSPPSRHSGESPRKDPIPWPALTNFGPAQLKRTASHLMKEWERSLTPSPGQEWAGEDPLGSGASSVTLTPGSPEQRRGSATELKDL